MPGLIMNLNKNKLKRKPLAATARFIVMAVGRLTVKRIVKTINPLHWENKK